MMQHIAHNNAEFQVVILAGGQGQRMFPLTEASPKALLPVGNRPLLAYQVALLEKAGFSEAIVVTTEEHSKSLTQFLSTTSGNGVKMKLDLHVVETGSGTADALRTCDCVLAHRMIYSG